jgi:hypothetical protein
LYIICYPIFMQASFRGTSAYPGRQDGLLDFFSSCRQLQPQEAAFRRTTWELRRRLGSFLAAGSSVTSGKHKDHPWQMPAASKDNGRKNLMRESFRRQADIMSQYRTWWLRCFQNRQIVYHQAGDGSAHRRSDDRCRLPCMGTWSADLSNGGASVTELCTDAGTVVPHGRRVEIRASPQDDRGRHGHASIHRWSNFLVCSANEVIELSTAQWHHSDLSCAHNFFGHVHCIVCIVVSEPHVGTYGVYGSQEVRRRRQVTTKVSVTEFVMLWWKFI